jgi:hypothetical protein
MTRQAPLKLPLGHPAWSKEAADPRPKPVPDNPLSPNFGFGLNQHEYDPVSLHRLREID